MYRPTPHFLAAVVGALAIFGTVAAFAQTVPVDSLKITYQNATEFVTPPGGLIPPPPDPTSLAGVRIQRSVAADCQTGAFGNVEETVNINVPASAFTFNNLRPAGRHCVRLASVLLNGTVGPWSPVLSKVIALPTPPRARPPTYTVE